MYKDSVQKRVAVVQEALGWLGTPFHHQAMVKASGVGCGTLLIGVYGSLGIPVPRVEELGDFAPDWMHHVQEERYLNILLNYTRQVTAPGTGDIALFKFGRAYSHSAIVMDWPRVIHVMWRRTVALEDAFKAPLVRKPVIFLSPFEK